MVTQHLKKKLFFRDKVVFFSRFHGVELPQKWVSLILCTLYVTFRLAQKLFAFAAITTFEETPHFIPFALHCEEELIAPEWPDICMWLCK